MQKNPTRDYFGLNNPSQGYETYLAFAGELGLELLYPSSSVHKAFFTGVCGVGIHCNITIDQVMIHPVNVFHLLRGGGRKSCKLLPAGHIDKAGRVEFGMYIFSHDHK